MKRGISFPLILGHEGAGIVESVGGAVRSLRSGDRVACTQWTETCGRCRFCRTNREPLCAERKFFGHDRDGTYAEYFKIQEDSLLVSELTDGTVTFNTARLFLNGVALLSTTSTSRTQLADTIALVGAGKLRPLVTERFPFDEAPRVHRLMVEKKLQGRVLLVP